MPSCWRLQAGLIVSPRPTPEIKHLMDPQAPTPDNPALALTGAAAPAPSSSSIPFRLWTDAERADSLRVALRDWTPGMDVWVYAYGSLIWRPDFAFAERRLATLHGYHRALCLWSRVNRGTPESPGLVFGLDRGGSCRGMVYRIAGENVSECFEALWRREMSTGAYLPRWLNCSTETGTVPALVFTMNRASPSYIPELPETELLAVIRRASGQYGACMDYVTQTAQALMAAGIRDRRLNHIVSRLNEERLLLPGS